MNFIRQLEILKKSGEDNDFEEHWTELNDPFVNSGNPVCQSACLAQGFG